MLSSLYTVAMFGLCMPSYLIISTFCYCSSAALIICFICSHRPGFFVVFVVRSTRARLSVCMATISAGELIISGLTDHLRVLPCRLPSAGSCTISTSLMVPSSTPPVSICDPRSLRFHFSLFLQACSHSTLTEAMSIPAPSTTIPIIMTTKMISMAVWSLFTFTFRIIPLKSVRKICMPAS